MVAWTVYLTQDSRDGGVLPHWKICREGHRACSVLREDPSPTSACDRVFNAAVVRFGGDLSTFSAMHKR